MKKRYMFFIFLVLFLVLLFFTPKVKNIFYDTLYPVLYPLSVVSDEFSQFFSLLKEKKALIEENNSLKKNIELLKAEIVSLKFLELENQKLRTLLNFSQSLKDYSFVSAKIIGYSPDNWSKVVFVNAGKKTGIKKGDLVLANGKLFGMVINVGNLSSKILLIGDKNFKITARTRKTRETVFFQGYDLKKGILTLVSPEQDIRVGDIVETESSDGSYPDGIPIGVISSVEYVEGEFFKRVFVSINLKPYSTEYIVIVKRKEK